MTSRVLLAGGVLLSVLAVLATFWLRPPAPEPGVQETAPASAPLPGPTNQGLAIRLQPGLSAAVLRVDAITGVAGTVRDGDRVDVLATFPAGAGGGQPTTRLVLRSALVLTSTAEGPGSSLTLAMTPDQALLLQQVEQLAARPYVVLHSLHGDAPAGQRETFTTPDLVMRLTGQDGGPGQGARR